jgi:anti-sigma regulatory factor (Ser/Thr protein kinase)
MAGTTTLQLPRHASCAEIARMIVSAHGTALAAERLKHARLLVSELVTNAFEHGRGTIRLTVDSDAAGLRAQVDDEGAIRSTQSDGYGLRFVAKLADDWGLDPDRSRVWFTVAS